jgi:DNA-binding beta-propeller fold protein YncE
LIDQVNISTGDSKNTSLREGTIKCTNWSTICLFTLKGQKIWDFKDQRILRKPKGIALDKNKNVYVAGMETNNVVVLSPDGKINIDRNELLVCNTNGQAFLFSLQYM